MSGVRINITQLHTTSHNLVGVYCSTGQVSWLLCTVALVKYVGCCVLQHWSSKLVAVYCSTGQVS